MLRTSLRLLHLESPGGASKYPGDAVGLGEDSGVAEGVAEPEKESVQEKGIDFLKISSKNTFFNKNANSEYFIKYFFNQKVQIT